MILNCISKSEVQYIARQRAKENAESSQQIMMTLFKTSPLERETCEMVVQQLIQRFESRITKIISYNLEKYQRDESELDRLAKELVTIVQGRVPSAKAAIGSGLEPQAPFVPSIVRDYLPDDGREDGQRYSTWEREIVSDRRAGYGILQRYPIDRPEVRANRLLIDIGDAEMGSFEPHLTDRVPRNIVFDRALSYRTYRLKNSDHRFLPRHPDRLGDFQKGWKVTFYASLFGGEEEIKVCNFLTQYKRVCEDTGISEGISLRVSGFT